MAISITATPQGCGFLTQPEAKPFAPEDFSADERLMIETAEQFSRNEILPQSHRLEKQEDGLMVDLIRKAGQLGFCGADTPEAYGGLGLPKNLAARILEYLSLDASFSVTIGVTSGIAQVGLSMFGNEEQKRRYLPRLASGEWIGAYALSEPDSGTDALSLITRAERTATGYRLNGTKMWISNAKWADFFLVMAKLDGEKISAFLVERTWPGVSVAREEHKMGLKGSSTARLVLEDVEVPAEALLSEEGMGYKVALNALNLGRFKLSSMSLGPAREAMRVSAAYANERKQFGQPIGRFGLIEKKFGLMAGLFFAAESTTYRTGALVDSAFDLSSGSAADNRKAAEEFSVECSICKVLATEAESFIVDEALQVFGGYGFTEEFPIARIYRDARVSRIYEGTNEINRVFTAGRIRKRLEDGRLDPTRIGGTFQAELLAKALTKPIENQVHEGALADLTILTFAESSATLRAQRVGGMTEEALNAFRLWANAKAAEAYQTLAGESVRVPEVPRPDWAGLAQAVFANEGPI